MNEMTATGMESEAGRRASGSSFYRAMRMLPKPQREAMFEIYSFCRAVDDIADEPGPRDARMMQLQKWRDDLAALYAGNPVPGLGGLARAVKEFDLRLPDFIAIIDGMEMDVVADIRAPDEATLDLYCDRVASAVGRLSVRARKVGYTPGMVLAAVLFIKRMADITGVQLVQNAQRVHTELPPDVAVYTPASIRYVNVEENVQ